MEKWQKDINKSDCGSANTGWIDRHTVDVAKMTPEGSHVYRDMRSNKGYDPGRGRMFFSRPFGYIHAIPPELYAHRKRPDNLQLIAKIFK